jgi:2-polyprenyl-3-methyl-5-hydroxy-6-metoxy-1,4-benzoquinol methylase
VTTTTASPLFERPGQSYVLDQRALGWIMADEANPLNRLVNLIPDGATVLDIGAGNGILPQLLRHKNRVVTIDGIEPDPAAVALAATWYRTLFQGTVEAFIAENRGSEHYDFIVMADVLEHLPNPERILRLLKPRLGSPGKICISTPNVAFASVRVALLNGVFDYVDSGILERTHLRFFTLRTLRRLFETTELFPESTMLLKRNPLDMEIRLQDFRVNPLLLSAILDDELASVYQFLFVLGAKPVHEVVANYGNPGRAVVLRYLTRRLLRRIPWYSRLKGQGADR